MNLIDYVEWRGDLCFDASPLNEVDALLLCQLSYINYGGIVPGEMGDMMSLAEVKNRFFNASDFSKRSNLGAMINKLTITLLEKAGESARFKDLMLTGFADLYCDDTEEQFSAVTFVSKSCGWAFVAFRGTDDTIVGWKEDFNLSFMENVPAQAHALEYLESASKKLRGKLYVGGHSKGGNLAVYAAVNSSAKTSKKIVSVFCNDGPGFERNFFEKSEYIGMKDRIRSYVPECSIVGMLFHHDDYITMKCDSIGILQHDPFNWHVWGPHFEEISGTSEESRFIDKTLNNWLENLSLGQRKTFVEALFGLLKNTNAKTNSELSANWFENLIRIMRASGDVDEETKKAINEMMKLLARSAIQNVLPPHHHQIGKS